ncbi:polypeptide N-acetylgalactosaminyltransferase 2-like [Penaeus monodon]|uniref:polypeptide N-acetylgalactosaminyltransferase 2-like n=1 Tax=Penaeus monodon TaxID=6687 RepID=UPI0018A70FEC|nr:polypeptide N-acetylgalactosaminyltransferase 2-like [Penaeus monodon]
MTHTTCGTKGTSWHSWETICGGRGSSSRGFQSSLTQIGTGDASHRVAGGSPISVVEAVGYLAGGFVRDKEHDPFARHAFNARASNALPNDRRLPDTRDPKCEQVAYDVDSLQTVSVVITFHNEARSALLRTVISVLTRTPDDLLEDLILVDDASDDPQDGQLLAGLPKVRVIRNDQRQGLIRSRVKGADASQGETIFFLDSHCEVNQGWAVPLLEVLREKPKTLACPVIDVIDQDTLDYRATGTVLKGGFDWGLHFRWVPLTQEEKDSRRDPTSTYRIAEVWLDEFTHFFYETRPNAINKPFGDVSERKEIRTKLKCRGFGWFLKTTYPELSTPSKHELAYGQLRQGDLCLQGPEADPKNCSEMFRIVQNY